jgi:hypothetical protein
LNPTLLVPKEGDVEVLLKPHAAKKSEESPSPSQAAESDQTPAPKGNDLKGLKSHAAHTAEEVTEAVERESQEELPLQDCEDGKKVPESISPRFHHSSPRCNWAENRESVQNNVASKQKEKIDLNKKQATKNKRKKSRREKINSVRTGFKTGGFTGKQEQVLARQDEEVDLGEYL